ncbi:SWIM zinc finger family protein [Kribbella sp. NPDC003505]|uniref:SWIM zinc finger family protein n=1 Tax=Kribbella sp. NPDC003505 TaxID=3154448 RepID=UPI0033BE33A4
MSIRPELVAVLGRYDDEAWAALASKGLLRRARKDLEQAPPTIVGEGPAALEVAVGTATVVFGPTGPTGATCSCPSGSTCQHIIAAGLWLTEDGAEDGAADGAEELGAELLQLTPADLKAFAGTAAYRWAREYVQDLDLEEAIRIEEGQHLVLTLLSPRISFHWMGAGLGGLVVDGGLRSVEKYQVAAVLAYQRASGLELEPIERRVPAKSGGENRRTLRSAVEQLLRDTVQLGVAHLSEPLFQRYETLAVSAQGAEYHRLAGLLRGMAGQVELTLARSAQADEQVLLEQLATTYALVSALGELGDLPRLVGSARGRFELAGKLELIGLGAYPWRTASGFAGLTVVFWSVDDGRPVTWTDSRPSSMIFEPRGRYTAPGPWDGLHSPSHTTGARLKLTGARLTANGRLSSADGTHAFDEPMTGAAIADAVPAADRWSDLLGGRPLSILEHEGPQREWAVLRPAEFAPARFDEVMQRLEWPVTDVAGDVLPLRLPYSLETSHAVDAIEARPEPERGTLVVARIRRTAEGLVGEPLSLIHPEGPAGRAVEALHFGGEASRRRHATGQALTATPAAPTELLDLRNWLVQQAERGTSAASSGAFNRDLDKRHQALRSAGFDVYPTGRDTDPPIALLRSFYLTLQVTQLLTGG